MKGIYITEEAKKELEAKVAELEKRIINERDCQDPIEYLLGETKGKQIIYKEILSSAIVLPVEESWENALSNTEVTDCIYSNAMNFPNGVIIENKMP